MDSMGSASNGIAFYYFDMDLHFGLLVHYFGSNSVVTATVSISLKGHELLLNDPSYERVTDRLHMTYEKAGTNHY